MRDILLDTHVFLWSQFEVAKLPPIYLKLRDDETVRWHLSQISLLEIQVKFSLGKLPLPAAPQVLLPELIRAGGFRFHALENEAIFMLHKLPMHHRDPFDRLLIASALVNGWEIATVDATFEKYPVRTVG